METTHVYSFSYVTSSPKTTSTIKNHRTHLRYRLPQQNVLAQQPMRHPTLKPITAAITHPSRFRFLFLFHQPKFFCAINITNNIDNSNLKNTIMADKYQSGSGQSTILNGQKEEEKKKLEKSTPPPPEKPLPGDCCGSGCVRCVWDIYYEDLEAYNKLYKNGPDSSISPEASTKQS
ncbi:hypothetical protein ACH5RR_013698 [Cinchona calisaya]|uniref:Oxidoreductase-like domain-containing protein n=1 Tax=Cinchona calisaya TaxID=153742 RepID=A0ABD3A319_9GENT